MHAGVRPAAVAGMFYPAEPEYLRGEIEVYLEAADGAREATPPIVIAPHAGYVYSGAVAARAFACMQRSGANVRRVVIFCPTHRVAVRGIAAPSSTAFRTPLGDVPVDAQALASVLGMPGVVRDDAAHAQEHAIEVQLPFLQMVLDRFSIVPLAVGMASGHAVAQIIDALWRPADTVFVVSSDLSHYQAYEHARATDQATVGRICALRDDIGYDEACGATAINGAIEVARERTLRPRLLALCNSGDTAGDRTRVVGYCAMAFEEREGGHA